MRPDLRTFRDHATARPRRTRSPERDARLQQAALAADYVTSSPEWNGYLALVQAQVEKDQAEINAIRNVLESEAFLPQGDLFKLRQQLAILGAVKRRAEEILAIPKTLQNEAQKSSTISKT